MIHRLVQACPDRLRPVLLILWARVSSPQYLRMGLNFLFSGELLLRAACYIPLRRVWRDGFLWLTLLAVVPFWVRFLAYRTTLEPSTYLVAQRDGSRPMVMRLTEALASARLFCLCRYYEGGKLLFRAVQQSMSQMGVPFFLFLTLGILFSLFLFELEWDPTIAECASRWVHEAGVPYSFLQERPDGVTWGCDVCVQDAASFECLTCRGYPHNLTQCLGKPFAQTFPSVPSTMWFVGVTMTTVGYGDVTPLSWYGKLVGGLIIVIGVLVPMQGSNLGGAHISNGRMHAYA